MLNERGVNTLSMDERGDLILNGQNMRLPPRERAVLGLLLQNYPNVVGKDTFELHIWGGQGMSDEALAACISRTRRPLHETGWRVESQYGAGYRLVGPLDGRPGALPAVQSLETFAHARQLLLQRSPQAVSLAIDLLRRLTKNEPSFLEARVALCEALVVAINWGQLPTLSAVDEGLDALKSLGSAKVVYGADAARGSLLDMAWRFEEAGACFQQAMKSEGERPETLLGYSRHLLYVDDAELAVDILLRLRRRTPHALHPRMNLARAFVQCGRGTEAVAEAKAAVTDHPGQLFMVAFSLAIQATVSPTAELEEPAWRLTQGSDTPPFVWTVASFVLARLGKREAALDIIETALLCCSTTVGEASLYAAPLASLGEHDRAAALLRNAADSHSGMLALMLRDPVHAAWLPHHTVGRALLTEVFGPSHDRIPPR